MTGLEAVLLPEAKLRATAEEAFHDTLHLRRLAGPERSNLVGPERTDAAPGEREKRWPGVADDGFDAWLLQAWTESSSWTRASFRLQRADRNHGRLEV